jgi:hypothetical protein
MLELQYNTYLRFYHMGQYFMEPRYYYDVPLNKVLHFIWNVGLKKGVSQEGKHNRSLKFMVQGARLLWLTPHKFMGHSFPQSSSAC